jgi:hypothetical protein
MDDIVVWGEATRKKAPGAAVTVAAASASSAHILDQYREGSLDIHMVAVPADETVTSETDS